jgi:general secretion pathway protein C
MNIQEIFSSWAAQSPEQLAAKASEHLPFWVSLTMAVLIAYYVARLIWLLVPAAPEAPWTPPKTIQNSAMNSSGMASDYTAIAEAHLFGEANAEAAPVNDDDAIDAPETRLNLTLRAAVADQGNRIAHAIIGDGSGTEKVYFIKDSVPGGATLHKVHPDRVILNRGGVLETLRLPRELAGNKAAPTAGSAAPAKPAQTVQQALSQNGGNFTQIIRPQPYMPGGQLKGYRVYPGRNRQQFAALGLRPGDLVTEINGTALNNPAQGMEVFRSLGESSQMTVTIERNGKSQALTLDVSQLSTGDGARQ